MRVRWYATRAGGMHVHIADPTQHRLHRYRSLATLTRADIGLGSVGNSDKAVTTSMCAMVCRPDWAHAHSQCCPHMVDYTTTGGAQMCSNLPSVQRRPRAGLEHGSPGIQLCAGVSQARAGLLVCCYPGAPWFPPPGLEPGSLG